jgi:hypothetical protein
MWISQCPVRVREPRAAAEQRGERLLHYLLGHPHVPHQRNSHAKQRRVMHQVKLGDRFICGWTPCSLV